MFLQGSCEAPPQKSLAGLRQVGWLIRGIHSWFEWPMAIIFWKKNCVCQDWFSAGQTQGKLGLGLLLLFFFLAWGKGGPLITVEPFLEAFLLFLIG